MNFYKIRAKGGMGAYMCAAKGHFATNHSHVNYCVDLTAVKTRLSAAKDTGEFLADHYQETPVDTVLCLEGTEVVGAFAAAALARDSFTGINSGADLCVATPELNANGQLVFRGSAQDAVRGKNVLLLLSSISTGKTVKKALDCLSYYGAEPAGVCALFSALDACCGFPVRALFTPADLEGYQTYAPGGCAMCAAGERLDAIVNDSGYSEL